VDGEAAQSRETARVARLASALRELAAAE
jgi:hypothetical protein